MKTQIAYSKDFNKHNNSGHPENAQRLDVMLNELKQTSFYNEIDFIEPRLLDEEILYSVHSGEMIQDIKDISETGDSWLDLDTYVCKSDYEIARKAASGLLQICMNIIDDKIDNGFALIRPPGHHATRTRSMGFCLFNNAAITANELAKQGKKVLIFDCDTHHGNGTQDIFYNRKDVLYQSFHLYPHFPGTGLINEIGKDDGKGYTINAPLCRGNGNKAISNLLDEIFLPISKQFNPDIIIISTGYDSHHSDLLGGLKLTSNFFGEIILEFQKIQPKIACTLEGGYNFNWIGKCFVSQIGQLMSQPVKFKDNYDESFNFQSVIDEMKNELSSFWKI